MEARTMSLLPALSHDDAERCLLPCRAGNYARSMARLWYNPISAAGAMSVTLTNAAKQARYRPSLEWVALGVRVAARQIRGKFFRSPERTMDRNVACSLIGAPSCCGYTDNRAH
jgi:hypothetical protein